MGIISDTFSIKEMVWEGMDKARCDSLCQLLENNKIKSWSFTRNQETPKCSGECGKCGGCNFEEGTPTYQKIGSGLSVNLLNEKKEYDIYTIYVKKADLEKALELIKAG